MFVWGFVPGFPHGAELRNHLGWCCRVLCQGHQACKECPAFGLGSAWPLLLWPQDASTVPWIGCESAKAKHPNLTSLVIVGRSGIQGVGKASILFRADWLEVLPYPMSLVWVALLEVVLRFKRYPAFGP